MIGQGLPRVLVQEVSTLSSAPGLAPGAHFQTRTSPQGQNLAGTCPSRRSRGQDTEALVTEPCLDMGYRRGQRTAASDH